MAESKRASVSIVATTKKRNYIINFPALGKRRGHEKKKRTLPPEPPVAAAAAAEDEHSILVDGVHISCTQSNRKLEIQVVLPTSTRILDFYFRLLYRTSEKGFPNPTGLKLFGHSSPTKEVLETATAIKTIQDYVYSHTKNRAAGNALMDNPNVLCICVGDGIGPATGYLAAASTKWKVKSIDPQMSVEWETDSKIPTLQCIRNKVELVDFGEDSKGDVCFIISVHGHANFDELYKRMLTYKRVIALSIPCCPHITHHVTGVPPTLSFDEFEIPSPMRKILLWDTSPTENF
ncbi:MAG: hypothetical protein Hyperionvirus22_32 [Hyperionvirus sp.]|uniref:Uncharacterized protein n=1 Tax=Hyperionvirus sp. TaxID=2487770 RepID=A0A3G5ADI7_9VIRU|nr:MAG: hypothetical protein Hyperionvirus22_32 [Hyperionvirus sp.]